MRKLGNWLLIKLNSNATYSAEKRAKSSSDTSAEEVRGKGRGNRPVFPSPGEITPKEKTLYASSVPRAPGGGRGGGVPA